MHDSPAASPDLASTVPPNPATAPADPATNPGDPAANSEDAPRQPGRPPVLGHNQKKRILTLLTAGCSRRAAARCVGCVPSTIANTALRDSEFALELTNAEANLETDLLEAVRNAAKVDRHWRAASWLLERKFPVDYTPHPPKLYNVDQISNLVEAVVATISDDLTPEQRQRIIKKLDAILAVDF